MFYGVTIPYYPSPDLINQYCNFHLGVVKNVADPMGRGRIKVEIPGLLNEGKENWTEWLEVSNNPVGTSKGDGDVGMWWPVEPGSAVLVGFIAGDPFALWALPAPPCQTSRSPNTQKVPLEPKARTKEAPRKGTRCKIIKSEAGHTMLMDDNGKSELFALLNWTGSGLAISGPGKIEDDPETEDEESKIRKNERRGVRNVFSGTSKKPSQICNGNIEYLGLLDLHAQGILTKADDENGGVVTLCARKSDGSVGPSIVLDGKNDAVFISVGKTQIQMFGDSPGPIKQRIFVTKQMIMQSKFAEVKEYFSGILNKLKKAFEVYG